MSHNLLSSAAARLTASASKTAAPPAASGGSAPKAEESVDVVTVADAQAACADSLREGAEQERARTNAVMTSAEGKAHPQMAAFMLNSTPGATADQIVAQLKTMPAASAASPAPAPEATTPPAPPAATADLTQTPKIEIAPNANQGEAEPAVDAVKFWDTQMSGVAANASPFGAPIAPGLPRTGN